MGGKWINDVHITDVEGSFGEYMLEADLTYEDKDGRLWITPKGFSGDMSSIPAFLRPFIPKTILGKAPWPHDFGYRTQPEGISRKQWDIVYREGAKAEGMSKRLAHFLYSGLRIGGWAGWRSNKSKIEKSK